MSKTSNLSDTAEIQRLQRAKRSATWRIHIMKLNKKGELLHVFYDDPPDQLMSSATEINRFQTQRHQRKVPYHLKYRQGARYTTAFYLFDK